ncbi:MAG: hypothetical protein WKG01_14495 [Kofleriaceae bacterium]
MKQQAEFRKVLVVWGIVVGLVIVAMIVGKQMWKRRAADHHRAEQVAQVQHIIADHDKLMKCLHNGQPDVVTGALVYDLHESEDPCESETERLQERLGEVAEELGLDPPRGIEYPAISVGQPESLSSELCTWVESLSRVTNQLATKVGLASVVAPSCRRELTLLERVQSPETQTSHGSRVVFASDELQVRYDNGDGTYTLARTKDGTRWTTKGMPRGWFERYDWSDRGFVAVAREQPDDAESPYRVSLLVDGTWRARTRLSVPVVDQILLEPDGRISVVAGPDGVGQHYLLRSRDGGKTFVRPPGLGGKPFVPADQATQLADGSTLVMSEPGRGPVRFEAHTFDAKGAGPVQVASLSWPEPAEAKQQRLETCRAGTAIWAVVRGRHLLFSETGQAWREVQDLGADLEVNEIACTPDRFALTSAGTTAELRSCDRTRCAERIAFPRTRATTIALRYDGPKLAVWYRAERGDGDRPSRSSPVGVYMITGGQLALERLYDGSTGGGPAVVHDQHGFFALDGSRE